MSAVTRVLNRIGTSDAVSWPVFWLTLLMGILGSFVVAQTGAALWIRALIIVAAQVALFLPLVVMKVLFLQRDDKPHPFIVLTGFVIAVLARAFTIIHLTRAFFPADPTTVADRILGNFLNVGLVLVLSAYMVRVMRERRYHIVRLEKLRNDLEQSINVVSSELTQRNEASVNRVREILEKELNLLDRDNPTGSLAILHDTATYVVRPLSYELAKEMPEVTDVQVNTDSTANWGQVLDRIATGRPFRPILTAAFMAVPLFAVVVTLRGTAAVMVPVPFELAALLAIANLVFSRFSPSLGALWRAIFMVLLSLLTGSIIGLGVWLAFNPGTQGAALAIAVTVFCVVFAIVVSIGAGVTQQRDQLITELTQSADNLARSLIRRKQTQWLQNKSLSRALHGPVQTAMNIAAIRIDEALRQGDVNAGMIDGVRADLISSLDVLSHSEGAVVSIDQGMNRIKETWDGICEIDISISPESIKQLDADVILRSCFIDIVTEAVSNAIRHGEANKVSITVMVEDRNVILDIRDNGVAVLSVNAPGLGSTQLDDCTLSWTLQSLVSGHRLTALLPT